MQILNPYFCTTETFQINGYLLNITLGDGVREHACTRTHSLQKWGSRGGGKEEDGRRLYPQMLKVLVKVVRAQFNEIHL